MNCKKESLFKQSWPWPLTKMAAMPIYGKNLFKTFLSETRRLITFKLGIQHQGLGPYRICSNDDPGLTLTYFTARSTLLHDVEILGFIETIDNNELKVGTNSWLCTWIHMSTRGQGHSSTFLLGHWDIYFQTNCHAAGHIKVKFEPRHEKTCLRGLRPGKTQTGLLSYREPSLSWNFGYRN